MPRLRRRVGECPARSSPETVMEAQMLFVIKKFFELAILHGLPCYIGFRWATTLYRSP